jgi:hypothetical protein
VHRERRTTEQASWTHGPIGSEHMLIGVMQSTVDSPCQRFLWEFSLPATARSKDDRRRDVTVEGRDDVQALSLSEECCANVQVSKSSSKKILHWVKWVVRKDVKRACDLREGACDAKCSLKMCRPKEVFCCGGSEALRRA